MILMIITHESEKERNYIIHYVKDLAGYWTEENWKMLPCATVGDLKRLVQEQVMADLICADITMPGVLELVKELRKVRPTAYIILVANAKISPLIYMRPSIGAESLMLKPLSEEQIQEVLSEAIRAYLRRFYEPNEERVFVVESGGSRNLIDYERILFFESRDKRVYLNTDSEEYGFYDTMEQLQERLDGFLRCHRSFLVNKAKIKEIFLSQNRIVLEGDFEVPLSRSYKPDVKEYLKRRSGQDEEDY